ncbi:MAG: NAD(P)-dependent oxidoreductase [Polyangiaceae bacterium]|nr:NAD(P)-dependent oxidoreductase [Polyangiaceae bacterium]
MATISVLGAGLMGAALVRAFARGGHAISVWNRTPHKAKALEAEGVRMAPTLLDATDADLIVDIVSDYGVSGELLRDAKVARALRGKTVLELATGTPAEAARAAAWASEHGIRYLDGAILATPDAIGTPGCTILYSGPREIFDQHSATLSAIADSGMYVGPAIGHANVLDNAILAMLWGTVQGTLLGAAICEVESFPLASFRQALEGSWPVVLPLLLAALGRVADRRWAAAKDTQSTLGPCIASARHIAEITKQHGLDSTLPEAFLGIFQRAVDAGHRDDDVAAAYVGMLPRA